jgi:eukaryotic-like serine/threonine-protein kinase
MLSFVGLLPSTSGATAVARYPLSKAAPMSANVPTTFLERLRASRLLTAEQIEQACAGVGEEEPYLSRYLVQQKLLTRFQAYQLRLGAARFHADKYVIVDYLGRGANSVVYKARHIYLPNRFVALKTLDIRDLHRSGEVLTRFRREIEIIGRLDHPNIVRAYDVLVTRSRVFLVLEYVDGWDLAKLVSRLGPLPVEDAVGYVIQAARGLSCAHQAGVVHRDIKPANLLVARDGALKLGDLGLARILSATPHPEYSAKGVCLGTPEFMAPEQAEGGANADFRSDLYSLGTTLYHLLTAELPIRGSSYLDRLKQLLTAPARPLKEVRSDVPNGLAAIVDRLRERDPSARPSSAEEAIALLEPFGRDTRVQQAGAWDGRHKAALVLDVLQGRLTFSRACERFGLTPEEFARWRRDFLEGAIRALDPLTTPPHHLSEGRINGLYAKVRAPKSKN